MENSVRQMQLSVVWTENNIHGANAFFEVLEMAAQLKTRVVL